MKQFHHLPFLLSILLLAPAVESRAERGQESDLRAGLNLHSAVLSIAEGEVKQAVKILSSPIGSPVIDSWRKIYFAEALLLEGRFNTAKNKIRLIPADSAARLYSELLKMEIDHFKSSSSVKGIPEHLKRQILESEAPLLKEKLDWLEILLLQDNSLKITRLLDFMEHNRRSVNFPKALRLIEDLRNTPEIDVSGDPALFLREITILLNKGLFDKALSLINLSFDLKLLGKKKGDSLREFSELIYKALRGTDNLKKLSLYTGKIVRILPDLFWLKDYFEAKEAWNRSDYKRAKVSLQKLPKNLPERVYLEAGIAEETGEYKKAVLLYKKAGTKKGFKHSGRGLLRSGWLSLYLKIPWNENVNQVKKLPLPKGGRKALSYWEPALTGRYAQGTPFGLGSYYYWLSRGKSLSYPNCSLSVKRHTEGEECTPEPVSLSDRDLERLKELGRFGVSYLTYTEAALVLKGRSNYLQKFKRAKILSYLGADVQSIKEIYRESNVFTRLKRECEYDLLSLLYPIKYRQLFGAASKKYSLPLPFLLAVARSESAFDITALSVSGAVGLMQLMPRTAEFEGLGSFNEGNVGYSLYIPEINVELGAKHLNRLLKKYDGKLYLAAAAYNAGVGNVDRWLKRYPDIQPELWVELIPYDETREYVKKVMSAYWIYFTSFYLNNISPSLNSTSAPIITGTFKLPCPKGTPR